MSDKDRGKEKASKSRPTKQHPRRPTQIAATTFLPSASSPALSLPPNPSPRSSHFTYGGPTPGSGETVATSETQSNGGKPILYLIEDGFLPSHPAAHGIAKILKSHYIDLWKSWKNIPIRTRDLFFGDFMKKFFVCPPDDRWARKNFDMRGATVMKNNLNKARSTMNKPSWMGDSVWDRLCQHWGTEEFKKKSKQAKTNRAYHCGGFGGSFSHVWLCYRISAER